MNGRHEDKRMKTCSRIQTLVVATLAVLFATQSWADVDLTGVWVKRTHEDWQGSR